MEGLCRLLFAAGTLVSQGRFDHRNQPIFHLLRQQAVQSLYILSKICSNDVH